MEPEKKTNAQVPSNVEICRKSNLAVNLRKHEVGAISFLIFFIFDRQGGDFFLPCCKRGICLLPERKLF